MSNNNPEEIYLQSKRIDEEETFLSKDIKRQQREIDQLIDEKVKEINSLKSEIIKLTKEANLYSKKAEMAEKRLDDEKQKNFMIQK